MFWCKSRIGLTSCSNPYGYISRTHMGWPIWVYLYGFPIHVSACPVHIWDAHMVYASTVDYMHKRIIHLLNMLKQLNCTPTAVNWAQLCYNYTLHSNSYGLVPNQFQKGKTSWFPSIVWLADCFIRVYLNLRTSVATHIRKLLLGFKIKWK